MANFYLSSLIASPQAPWRVYGAAILARHINHATAVCLLQRQQHQYHQQRMLSQGGNDDDDGNVSSSMAMAQDGSRGDSYEGVSRLPLDNTLSLIASMLAPPPPSPSSPLSSSSHALRNRVDVGGAAAGRLLTERDLSDALNTPFLVTSLAVTTASTTSTTTADADATNSINNDTNNEVNPPALAPALAASVLPPTLPSPPENSLTLTQPMRQVLALFLLRVWQFPIRLDAAAAATTTAMLSSSSSLSPSSSSMLTMVSEPLCLFEGKRLAEVGRLIGWYFLLSPAPSPFNNRHHSISSLTLFTLPHSS